MSDQFALPIREMEALAKTKHVTFPTNVSKPQVWEQADAGTFEPDPPPVWRTLVKIFVLDTGNDPGTVSEVQGFIRFDTRTSTTKNFSVDLADETSFRDENGGLGRCVATFSRDTAGSLPANFRGFLAQVTTFRTQVILDTGIDWTDPANLVYLDGKQRYFSSSNVHYHYTAQLLFQVTRLPYGAQNLEGLDLLFHH